MPLAPAVDEIKVTHTKFASMKATVRAGVRPLQVLWPSSSLVKGAHGCKISRLRVPTGRSAVRFRAS